jgi:hypothetical protein
MFKDPLSALRAALREHRRAITAGRTDDAAGFLDIASTCAVKLEEEALWLRCARTAARLGPTFDRCWNHGLAAYRHGYLKEGSGAYARALELASEEERFVQERALTDAIARSFLSLSLAEHPWSSVVRILVPGLTQVDLAFLRAMNEGLARQDFAAARVADPNAFVVHRGADECLSGRIGSVRRSAPPCSEPWSGIARRLLGGCVSDVELRSTESSHGRKAMRAAVRCLLKAFEGIAWDPGRSLLFASRGRVFVREEALSVLPDDGEAATQLRLAIAFFQMAHHEAARDAIKRARALAPNDPKVAAWENAIMGWDHDKPTTPSRSPKT